MLFRISANFSLNMDWAAACVPAIARWSRGGGRPFPPSLRRAQQLIPVWWLGVGCRLAGGGGEGGGATLCQSTYVVSNNNNTVISCDAGP